MHLFFFRKFQLITVLQLICDSVWGIFHCQPSFVFIKVYIFAQQKAMDSLTLKVYNSFPNSNRKATPIKHSLKEQSVN